METNCTRCQHSIDHHPAIYAAILALESAGELPPCTYESIVIQVCEAAGCPIA